ncbi:MAG: hypothetical protein WBP81_31655 [Solirubrobacteraceae bacterium]
MDLDAAPAALSLHGVDGVVPAGANLVEHGLASDAELPARVVELDVVARHLGCEPASYLEGQANAPRSVRAVCSAGSSPSAKRRRMVCVQTPSWRVASSIDTPYVAGFGSRGGGDVRALADPATRTPVNSRSVGG